VVCFLFILLSVCLCVFCVSLSVCYLLPYGEYRYIILLLLLIRFIERRIAQRPQACSRRLTGRRVEASMLKGTTPPPLDRSPPKFACVITSWTSATNVIKFSSGVSSPRVRDFAHFLFSRLLFRILGVLVHS